MLPYCKYPQSKNKGFIILIVLLFMQIFSLLGWCAINNVSLFMKMTKNNLAHDLLYRQAEVVLSHIESATVSELPNCIIPFTETDALIAKPLNWWQLQACSGTFSSFKYYYVVESLAVDPCAIVLQMKQTFADYYRVTLFLYLKIEDARIFLQSTLIRPDFSTKQHCAGARHNVQVGRQSWRELDD